jgi:hypothetical protein
LLLTAAQTAPAAGGGAPSPPPRGRLLTDRELLSIYGRQIQRIIEECVVELKLEHQKELKNFEQLFEVRRGRGAGRGGHA